MIWEERRTVVRRGRLADYVRLMLDEMWPALTALKVRPLCLLNGLIGVPAEETYTFIEYEQPDDWFAYQYDPTGTAEAQLEADGDDPRVRAYMTNRRALDALFERRQTLVEEERVRLLDASVHRPLDDVPPADRRAVYGMRRFSIHPRDWPDFERYSAEGVWRRIEAQDARILGLFRDTAGTVPLEVTLLTGYHGPGHWEETRGWKDRPPDFPADLWDLGQRSGAARTAITLRSHVCLMNAHWPRP